MTTLSNRRTLFTKLNKQKRMQFKELIYPHTQKTKTNQREFICLTGAQTE